MIYNNVLYQQFLIFKMTIKMKKLTFAIGSLLINIMSFSQGVSFSQREYRTGQPIIATGLSSVSGIENGIKNSSQNINTGTNQINLGPTSTPGLYFVNFVMVDGTNRLFLVGVKPNTATNISNSIYDLGTPKAVNTSQANIFKRMLQFYREQPSSVTLAPLKKGLQTYCVNNSVSIVHNVAFCVAATQTGLPIITAICTEMTKDALEDLLMEIFKETFVQMAASGYLTAEEINTINSNLDFYTNIGKMIDENCSGFFDYVADKINNPNIKLAIKYQGQLCSSTVMIVKEYKKLP